MLSISRTSRKDLFKGCNVSRVQVIERKDIKGLKPLWYFSKCAILWIQALEDFSTSSIIDTCAKILDIFIIFSLVFIDSFHLVLIFLSWRLPLFGLLSILSCGQITHSLFFCERFFWFFFCFYFALILPRPPFRVFNSLGSLFFFFFAPIFA